MDVPHLLQDAARDIHAAAKRGEHYPAAWRGRFDLDDAYRVQLAVLALQEAEGARQAGWKVGLTAKAIQEQEGFHEPIFGILLQSGALPSGSVLRHAELIEPAFENELCVVLNAPLGGPGVTGAQARAAIASVAPALEIVERRGVFSAAPELAIADNVGQKAFVTGTAQQPPAGFALADARCEVWINGACVDHADGSAVLGDPAEAIAWLANKLASYGRRIEAGQPIMSGSFTRAYPLQPGDRVETRFAPFGTVAVQLD